MADPYSWLDALPDTANTSKAVKGDALVFTGQSVGYEFDASGRPTKVGTNAASTASAKAVSSLYYDWDDKQKAEFKSALALTGVDTTGWQDGQFANAWGSYVGQAAAYYRNGQGKQITPWDVLVMDRRNREGQVPKTTTNTSTSVNLSSQADVEAAAYDIARSLLGRAPTDAEIARYTSIINARERANPAKTTTTTTTQPGGDSTSSSTSSGGFGAGAAQDEIRKQAQGEEGYAEYQAATTYFGALMGMLGGG